MVPALQYNPVGLLWRVNEVMHVMLEYCLAYSKQ